MDTNKDTTIDRSHLERSIRVSLPTLTASTASVGLTREFVLASAILRPHGDRRRLYVADSGSRAARQRRSDTSGHQRQTRGERHAAWTRALGVVVFSDTGTFWRDLG